MKSIGAGNQIERRWLIGQPCRYPSSEGCLENPGAVLLGLKQLLAPLGQLVIEDYARRGFPFPWKVFEWFIKHDDPGHIRAYTLTEAQALCQQAGLWVELAKTFPIDVLWKGWVVHTEIEGI